MIRNEKTIKAFDGNTAYTATEKNSVYDFFEVEITEDMAWDIANDLLTDLRNNETNLSLRFYEKVSCTCDSGHICDGNRGHNFQGCPQNCPVHKKCST